MAVSETHLPAAEYREEEARETVATVERLSQHGPQHREDEPDPASVRGTCPACGGALISDLVYVGGRGYLLMIRCWNGTGSHRESSCDYRRML